MSDAARAVIIGLGGLLSIALFQLAWTLWRMPDWQRREFTERRERRLYNRRMIRLWLSGGKDAKKGPEHD